MLLGSLQGRHIAVITYILQKKNSECRIAERLNCLIFKIQTQNNVHNFPSPFPSSRRNYFRIGLLVLKYSSHQKDLIAKQMQSISVWVPSLGVRQQLSAGCGGVQITFGFSVPAFQQTL